MASIVPGYEYDIFISYRHNDNRSGWVTEFVAALQEELATTIKEPVSVYFDTNPHDGLLETHNVGKSLEAKLKCLIFIPVISQTYCDPKSYAWQYEFVAFNKSVKEDRFGRDIRLPNGNVASRILPIKIHDLDKSDTALLESELDGVLRCIEFIFKSPGVNRPLSANENHPKDNLNKTYYKDQINKAANAIKEIITGIQNPDPESMSESDKKTPRPATLKSQNRKPLIAIISSLFLLLLVGYFLYPKIFKSSMQTEPDKSIAVLPFVNMSADPDQEYFSDGLSEELLNLLAKIPDLKVIGRTSSFSFRDKNEDLRKIGNQLGVSYLMEGSVRKSGDNIRITANLIKAEDGSHLWSETYDRKLLNIFEVQDDIAASVVDNLKLTIPGLSVNNIASKNIEAYNLLLQANYLAHQPGSVDKSIELMERAILLDSSDARIWAGLARAYSITWEGNDTIRSVRAIKARRAAEKSLSLQEDNAAAHFVLGKILREFYWDWDNSEKELRKAEELSPEYASARSLIYQTFGRWEDAIAVGKRGVEIDLINPTAWHELGHTYELAGRFKEAIPPLKRALELNPNYDDAWQTLGRVYRDLGQYKQALEFLNRARNQEDPRLIYFLQDTYRLMGNTSKMNFYKEKMIENDGRIDYSIAIAATYAQFGENDSCFVWLQKAYDRKHPAMCLLKVGFPEIIDLHDPRFNEFLAKMNLPIEN